VPKVSQEHLDARREQILEGAQRCFARHGYAGATVARLEEEIGLSRGAIFNYFPSKQDLFVELAAGVSRRYGDLLVERGVDAAIHAMAEEDPEWLGVLLEAQAQLRHDPEFTRKLEAAHEAAPPRSAEWFGARQQDGTFRGDVEATDLARFATMVLNGFALRVVGGDATNVASVVRLLRDALAPRE
jgi:AcrR family transcriptional regulator